MLISVKICLKFYFGIWVIILAQFLQYILCTVIKLTILSQLLLVCIRSYECLISFHYCPVPCFIDHFTYHLNMNFQTAYWLCLDCRCRWLTYNFCKKEKIMSLNRQFREIKFPANTVFLHDREIKDSRNVLRKFSRNLSPMKLKENKVPSSFHKVRDFFPPPSPSPPPLQDGMLVHWRITLSIWFTCTYFYFLVETGTIRKRSIVQEEYTVSLTALDPEPLPYL